jgi:prenyltransferase beta subunit
MNKLDKLTMKDELVEWLVKRQELGGLNGRPHKEQDTCYSFWVGATLKSLDALEFISQEKSIEFTLRCQHDKMGGVCKHMKTV